MRWAFEKRFHKGRLPLHLHVRVFFARKRSLARLREGAAALRGWICALMGRWSGRYRIVITRGVRMVSAVILGTNLSRGGLRGSLGVGLVVSVGAVVEAVVGGGSIVT